MSIYGSLPAPSDDHLEGCAKWVAGLKGSFEGMITDSGSYGFDDSQPCTCGLPETPLIYRGSHILPSETDERGGWVDIASIAGFITRDGRDGSNEDLDYDTPWPYLRFGVNNQTVVLTERQVRQVADTLNEWLALPKVVEQKERDVTETKEQLETVFFNDRYVTRNARWMIQNGGVSKSDLCCIHSVGLGEYCDECVEERIKPK